MKVLPCILFLLLVTHLWADETKPDLDNPATLEKILAEAGKIDELNISESDGLLFYSIHLGGSRFHAYTGWAKSLCSEGTLAALYQLRRGRRHGVIMRWESGTKVSRTEWECGRKHGLSVYWHQNSKKELERSYAEGKKHGLETEWDEEGNIISQTRYQNGEKVEENKDE